MALRHVVVGAGPAAVSAAQAIRSQDPTAEILLVSEDPHGYYSRPGLAYFLLNQVPANLLSPVLGSRVRPAGHHHLQPTP